MRDPRALLSVPLRSGGSSVFPSVQSERDDVRIGDARQFIAEVERLAASAPGGGQPPRLDRITGPDRTGTAFAVVDAVGRFIDIGLHPGWPMALGPGRVAAALLEALAAARLKAAMVPMILCRSDPEWPRSVDHWTTAGDRRISEARRLIDDGKPPQAARVITGPRGLFRLHVRGGHLVRAEVTGGLTAADTDRLLADARAAFRQRAWPAAPTMA